MAMTDMGAANQIAPLETDWVERPLNTGLERITELAARVEYLEDLATKAYKARDKSLLAELRSVPLVKAISLEGVHGTITQKNIITVELTNQCDKVKAELDIALEAYIEDIQEDFEAKLKEYGKLYNKLRATDADIETPANTSVPVNHTRLYEMFHIKNEFFGKNPLSAVRKEEVSLKRLVTSVNTGLDRISRSVKTLTKGDKLDRKNDDLPKIDALFLMFNRRVSLKDGQMEHSDKATGKPKKSFTWKQHLAIVIGSIFFKQAGGTLVEAFMDKKDSTAKVENKLSEIHRFIRFVEGFEDIVADLDDIVSRTDKMFKETDEENHSSLNRRIAPVMELAEFIMKQICDVTAGTDKLFSRLARKGK